jgi:hypothetical protein
MLYAALKVLITAVLVVAISEVAKRSSLFGGLIASLPVTSLLAFLWLYGETGDTARIAGLSQSIFWLVIPSLVLFLALPVLLAKGFGFWISLLISCGLTVAAYLGMIAILSRFGVTL